MNHASEHVARARSMLLLDSASSGRPSISSTKLCARIRLLKVQSNASRWRCRNEPCGVSIIPLIVQFEADCARKAEKAARQPGRAISFREEAPRHGAPMQFPRFGYACEDRITTAIGP